MTTSVGSAGGSTERGALRRISGAIEHLVTPPDLRVLFVANVVLGMAASFVPPFMSMFCTLEVGWTH